MSYLSRVRWQPIVLSICLLSMLGCAGQGGTTTQERAVKLDKWRQVGDAKWHFGPDIAWALSQSDTGFLVSRKDYRDFRLSIEFWVGAKTNSGIFVRCSDMDDINPEKCYEINIWDEHPNQDNRTGSIVGRVKPLTRVDTVDRWNQCMIEVVGNQIRVLMNGEETARFRDNQLALGRIAIQYGGTGTVRFRNLKLSAL